MKCTFVLFLAAASLFAADFTTGQAARMVIGQETFTAADPNSSNTVLGGASGIAYAGDTLFVADSNRIGADPSNHRVLLFQGLSSMLPAPTDELQDNRKCPVCLGTATVVLGQPDFTTATENIAPTQSNLRQATAVSSDGVHLVVADTNHNRLLIWNRIPNTNNAPADVVVGQPDFSTASVPTNGTPSAKSLSGPQGVWIQNGKLYVADTGNHRVLIYNRIPTTNGVAADVVLGEPDFTTFVQSDISQQDASASPTNLLNPVSVTSDGTRLFVTDLGHNRVLIWNSIPTSNAAPADVAVGQPDMVSAVANNSFSVDPNDVNMVEHPVLCTASNGVDVNNNPTYPADCNATLNFPRFALSDGTRLFIADGGNDRILEFRQIPTQSGASADTVLGQIGGTVDQATDATDSLNTPTSLAWDGTNLYACDPYNRRITVYTAVDNILAYQAVVNAASLNVNATGAVGIGGSIQATDIITVTINSTQYTYKVVATDTLNSVIAALAAAINAGQGDSNVIATVDDNFSEVVLTARAPGTLGNNIGYSATVSTNSVITATAAGSTLAGGGNAAQVAPGTLVTISGANLSAGTAAADLSQPQLPRQLVNTEVYFNGIMSPLVMVSPTQINAQIPWELTDTTSINAYVRSVMSDGSVMVTSPVAVTIVQANPGVFTQPNTDPALAVAYHGTSFANGIVSVDGVPNAGDVQTITVGDNSYSYTTVAGDTLDTVRDNLVSQLSNDPLVTASAAGAFDRIILQARVQGPEGNGIAYSASASTGAGVTMTAFGTTTCCGNVAGAPLTQANPAVAGEIIYVYATGLGVPVLNGDIQSFINTGSQYPSDGPITTPQVLTNSIAGGSTADLLTATLQPGMVGVFKVVLHLNSGLSSNPYTSLTVAQDIYVSNVVAIPVVSQ